MILKYEDNNNITNDEILEYIKNYTNSKISMEWKIKKNKYILKNGKFGYYLEEYINNEKTRNIPISKLINTIKTKKECDDAEAVTLIKKKDIDKFINF